MIRKYEYYPNKFQLFKNTTNLPQKWRFLTHATVEYCDKADSMSYSLKRHLQFVAEIL